MRKLFIAGNWKMNTVSSEVVDLLTLLKKGASDIKDVDFAVFPPAVYLKMAADVLGDSNIYLGAQNMCWEEKGAYTGELSSIMLQDIGGSMVILGHSERRHVFFENDAMINSKIHHAIKSKIKPILCIGETLEEREQDKTDEVVFAQISAGLKNVSAADIEMVTIAYEPVWAIGTGKTATPEQAQDVHKKIRNWLISTYGEGKAAIIRILYGGSVKPENACELMGQVDIDGALVGGASLNSESFLNIAREAL